MSKYQWHPSMFSGYYIYTNTHIMKKSHLLYKWCDKLKAKWWKYIEKHVLSYVYFVVYAGWHFKLWLEKIGNSCTRYFTSICICWCSIERQFRRCINMDPFRWSLLFFFNSISQWQFQIYSLQSKPRARSYCGTMTLFIPLLFLHFH